ASPGDCGYVSGTVSACGPAVSSAGVTGLWFSGASTVAAGDVCLFIDASPEKTSWASCALSTASAPVVSGIYISAAYTRFPPLVIIVSTASMAANFALLLFIVIYFTP